MLTHKNCGVGIVDQIASQVRQLRKNLSSDIGVSLCWSENAKTG